MNSLAVVSRPVSERWPAGWLILGLAVVAYLSMYVDGAVHGVTMGAVGEKLAYLHEFFHHARHLALACH